MTIPDVYFSGRLLYFHDVFTFRITGAAKKAAKSSLLHQHGIAAFAAKGVCNFRFLRFDDTVLSFFNLYDVLAFRVSGAAKKWAKFAAFHCHLSATLLARDVTDFFLNSCNGATFFHFNINNVPAFRIACAAEKRAKFAAFHCHRKAAFLASLFYFHRLVFCGDDLTIVSTGKIHGILACWIVGAGYELTVFTPLYNHVTSAFITYLVSWSFFSLDISHVRLGIFELFFKRLIEVFQCI
jgi:hypothetical protein